MSVLDTISGWKDKAVKLEKDIQASMANHNFIAGQLDAAKAMIQELEMKFAPEVAVAEKVEESVAVAEDDAPAVEVAVEAIEDVV